MPSHRPKIDYSLRPAKAAERRMVVDALARLDPLVPVARYRYVGMGSIYFRDFQLVHRRLGIDEMVSIEGAPDAEDRVRFNVPLACIDLVMGTTGEVLPRIDLEEKPHVLWLDYESRVDPDVLADIDEAVGRCAPGSVLIVTTNADHPDDDSDRERWLNEIGHSRPEPVEPRTRSEYARLSYKVLSERIHAALTARNAGVPDPDRRIEFRQTFHLVYADGAQMITVGGGLVAESDHQRWDECGVDSLEFSRSGEDPYQLKIPRLTRREIHHLLSALPAENGDITEAARTAGIPPKDARQFAAIYRFAPLFVEAEDF